MKCDLNRESAGEWAGLTGKDSKKWQVKTCTLKIYCDIQIKEMGMTGTVRQI